MEVMEKHLLLNKSSTAMGHKVARQMHLSKAVGPSSCRVCSAAASRCSSHCLFVATSRVHLRISPVRISGVVCLSTLVFEVTKSEKMSKSKKPTLDLSLSASSSSDNSDLEDVDVDKADENVDKKTDKKKSKKKDFEDELAGSDYEEMLRSASSTTTDDDEVRLSTSKKGRKKKAGPKKKKRKSARFGGGDEDDDDDDNDDDADEEIDITNIGARLGLLLDAADLEELEEEEERVPVDPVIEELLNKGLGKGKAKQKKEKKLREQITRLSAHTALEVTSEGRLNVLVEDVETVRKTKEKVDALVKVLEAMRDKMIKEEDSLSYTEPPSKTKPPTPKSRFGECGSSSANS